MAGGSSGMRWRRNGVQARSGRDLSSSHRPARDRIRVDLERREVGPDLALSVAARLEGRLHQEGPEIYEAMLDGVAVAWELGVASEEFEQAWRRNLSELRELERLMGNFVGELSKLDEALEVLSAYLRRMRTNASRHGGRLFH